jgi:hypothetical protein
VAIRTASHRAVRVMAALRRHDPAGEVVPVPVEVEVAVPA